MEVHFILTRGELIPDYQRAIRSAAVHGKPIVLWYTGNRPPDTKGLPVHLEHVAPLVHPHPTHIAPAHLWDLLALQIGAQHGGMVLGLDTISIRTAWDLLHKHASIVVSTDQPPWENPWLNPYNNNFICRGESYIVGQMFEEARRRIRDEPEVWGYTGPGLLTWAHKKYGIQGAPYPALCGWSSGLVWQFFLGMEEPKPEVCVIHLCRTAYIDLAEGRFAKWAAENPSVAWCVRERSDRNKKYLDV